MTDSTVRFGLLCSMFQAMLRDRSAAKKRKRFQTFLERVYTGRDYFSAVRLILPALDRERGSYGLKEAALAASLVDALGISKDSDDARRLVNWRRGGARSGANAGNFALVAAEVLQRRQGMASGGLTIKEVNEALDQIASGENRGEKSAVFSSLIKKTNALEMKWILMIILKDLKLGVSEKSIFHEFHPDAEDMFNVTCDLKLVCEKLSDRSQRHKRQDIDVGKAVRPQLALRVADTNSAWKKFQGRNIVAECKFDGDRIQVHKNGTEIHFFSRNFLDHSEYVPGMSAVIIGNILVDRCILDGEMLVWDTSANRFSEFGSNQEIAKAAREGLENDRQLCYVAFDILYVGDTSVIHQSLAERQVLLQKVVKPLKGRLEILVPNDGINDHRIPGEPCWSILAYTLDDVEKFFKETVENRDEGIVLKDLGSKWEPGDRSGKWLKLKPDYINAGADLDALIIGGYFGSGRHGGEVAQFLVGLALRSDPGMHPKRFMSFCRVGTGLSDEELNTLITTLKPYFRKNEYPKRIPRFYDVTNNSKERPDVWIDIPDKSVILSITSDIRTIKSEVFAAPYCLRFPRIQRVRYDKPWYECLDVESFVELVHASNGSMQRSDNQGQDQNQIPKRKNSKQKEQKKSAVVPSHFVRTDISGVKKETLIFSNMMFYFINTSPSLSIDEFHKLVVENGGTFSMNLNDSVTHCIAAEKKGIKYQAAMRHGDIIHCSWVLDCCKEKRVVHVHPKYFLFLAESSKMKLQDEIDQFNDYYYWDLDLSDIKQIFSNMTGSESSSVTEYYKKKYCPLDSLCLFADCCIYFIEDVDNTNEDIGILSEFILRRLKLEVAMRGGKVSSNFFHATHLIAYSSSGSLDFNQIYNQVPSAQRCHFRDERLHVVKHQWLEDSLKEMKLLPEYSYCLKPNNWEEFKDTISRNCENEAAPDAGSNPASAVGNLESVYGEGVKRKRGRPASSSSSSARGRQGHTRPAARRTRARIGNRRAELHPNEPEGDSPGEAGGSRDVTPGPRSSGNKEESNRDGNVQGALDTQGPSYFAQLGKDGDKIFRGDVREERFDKTGHEDDFDDEGGQDRQAKRHSQVVDPLHSMLLDMIPSLIQKNTSGTVAPVSITASAAASAASGESSLRKMESGSGSSIPRGDEVVTEAEQGGPPPRKKKVSYKDVAGQLLGDDW